MDVKEIERKKSKILVEWQDEDEGLVRGEAPKALVNGGQIEDAILPLVKKVDAGWVTTDIHIPAKTLSDQLKAYGIFTKEDARKNPEKIRRLLGVLTKDALNEILRS